MLTVELLDRFGNRCTQHRGTVQLQLRAALFDNQNTEVSWWPPLLATAESGIAEFDGDALYRM